ncbi:hypothetical protein [Breznakiella homolactica]
MKPEYVFSKSKPNPYEKNYESKSPSGLMLIQLNTSKRKRKKQEFPIRT